MPMLKGGGDDVNQFPTPLRARIKNSAESELGLNRLENAGEDGDELPTA